MTPLQFEQTYGQEWAELEASLAVIQGRRGQDALAQPVSGARVAALYRRACEHLALARARSYPAHIVDRLDRVTVDAHESIYRRRELGLSVVKDVLTTDFPRAVRHHRAYVAVAAAVFVLPTLILGILVYRSPELILSVVSPETAASFEWMYSPSAESIGRTAETDWMMFGYYIRNNIGVAFQCFASGLFAGVGTLFFLAYNGAFGGAVAGFLTAQGLSSTFYSFIVTHAAFEMTAIVLAGAAGLRVGRSIVAPGRLTRRQALVAATRETATLLYGVTAMLIIAAGVEAFWSSATWLPPAAKYVAAAICWIGVIGYLTLQGRRAG